MAHRNDPLAAGVHTAHTWLNAVADELGTEDRQFAFRALRAWMHTVRDRIGLSDSAHMSAQLPELLRGVWYEGWVPARVPVRHGVAAFIDQFAEQARIDRGEVVPIAGPVGTPHPAGRGAGRSARHGSELSMLQYTMSPGRAPGRRMGSAAVRAADRDTTRPGPKAQLSAESAATHRRDERITR